MNQPDGVVAEVCQRDFIERKANEKRRDAAQSKRFAWFACSSVRQP